MKIILYRKLFWRVKLVAKNGETLFTSESYFSKGNAKIAANRVAKALSLPVFEKTK